jgi:hypothetical protein
MEESQRIPSAGEKMMALVASDDELVRRACSVMGVDKKDTNSRQRPKLSLVSAPASIPGHT